MADEEEYVVEKIVKKAKMWNDEKKEYCDYYFVKWRGWNEKHNTWEPEDHLDNCRMMVDAFNATEKEKAALPAIAATSNAKRKSKSPGNGFNAKEKARSASPSVAATSNTKRKSPVDGFNAKEKARSVSPGVFGTSNAKQRSKSPVDGFNAKKKERSVSPGVAATSKAKCKELVDAFDAKKKEKAAAAAAAAIIATVNANRKEPTVNVKPTKDALLTQTATASSSSSSDSPEVLNELGPSTENGCGGSNDAVADDPTLVNNRALEKDEYLTVGNVYEIPNYRNEWHPHHKPLSILGSDIVDGTSIYFVKLLAPDELHFKRVVQRAGESAKKFQYKGFGVESFVTVPAHLMNYKFPDLTADFMRKEIPILDEKIRRRALRMKNTGGGRITNPDKCSAAPRKLIRI